MECKSGACKAGREGIDELNETGVGRALGEGRLPQRDHSAVLLWSKNLDVEAVVDDISILDNVLLALQT